MRPSGVNRYDQRPPFRVQICLLSYIFSPLARAIEMLGDEKDWGKQNLTKKKLKLSIKHSVRRSFRFLNFANFLSSISLCSYVLFVASVINCSNPSPVIAQIFSSLSVVLSVETYCTSFPRIITRVAISIISSPPKEGESVREADIYSGEYGIDSTVSDIIPCSFKVRS